MRYQEDELSTLRSLNREVEEVLVGGKYIMTRASLNVWNFAYINLPAGLRNIFPLSINKGLKRII